MSAETNSPARMQLIKVVIESSGVLHISLGVDLMARVACDVQEIEISDSDIFAADIVSALTAEEEDGTTLWYIE